MLINTMTLKWVDEKQVASVHEREKRAIFLKKTKIRIIEIIMTIPWSILVLFFREKQNFKSNFIVEHKFSCLIEKIKFQSGQFDDIFGYTPSDYQVNQ